MPFFFCLLHLLVRDTSSNFNIEGIETWDRFKFVSDFTSRIGVATTAFCSQWDEIIFKEALRSHKVFIRRLVGSTDPAYSSGFYFRIAWKSMKRPSFLWNCSLSLLQGLRSTNMFVCFKGRIDLTNRVRMCRNPCGTNETRMLLCSRPRRSRASSTPRRCIRNFNPKVQT